MSDLINRSELIETIKSELDYASATAFCRKMNNIKSIDLARKILSLIDNAPAIDISGNEYFPYRTAYFNGVADGRATTRSSGEWIDHSEEGYVECPFCEHLTNCEDNIDELHYCWNCGAYMRKGGSNERRRKMIGKWEKVHYGDYPFLAKCSRCGHEIDTHYEGKHPNFCSNCGLPMNEEAARRLNTVLYLCDKQNPECEKTNCGGDFCHRTSDVNHAVNFEPMVDQVSGEVIGYMEKESVETTSSEWIPITFRQADDEEYEKTREVYDHYWADLPREECKVYDCRMPDDGQEVLITTSWGEVCEDTYHTDDVLAGFEDHDDPDDVIAWMPKPEAYKKEDAK